MLESPHLSPNLALTQSLGPLEVLVSTLGPLCSHPC